MKAARRKESRDQLVKLPMEVHSELQGGETLWGWGVGGVRSSVVAPQERLDRPGTEENTEGEASTLLLATQNFPRQNDNVNNG